MTILGYMILSLLFLAFGSSYSQPTVGIRAGFNRSHEHMKEARAKLDSRGINAWVLGLYVSSNFSEKIANQIEVSVSSEGGTFSGAEETSQLTYVSVPVFLKFLVSPKFTIVGGTRLGFLTGGKLKTSTETINVKDLYAQHNWSLLIGFEAEILNKTGIGMRYLPGLTDVDYSSNELIKRINSTQLYLTRDF